MGEPLTDVELAEYVREHRCHRTRRDVTIADWDRGIAAIERAARADAEAEHHALAHLSPSGPVQ